MHTESHKMGELEQKVVDLKQELSVTLSDLHKVQATLEFKDEELARKSDELTQLNQKVKVSNQMDIFWEGIEVLNVFSW